MIYKPRPTTHILVFRIDVDRRFPIGHSNCVHIIPGHSLGPIDSGLNPREIDLRPHWFEAGQIPLIFLVLREHLAGVVADSSVLGYWDGRYDAGTFTGDFAEIIFWWYGLTCVGGRLLGSILVHVVLKG